MNIVSTTTSLLILGALTACSGGSSSTPSSEASNPVNESKDGSLSLTYGAMPAGINVDGAQYVDDIKYGEHDRQRFDFYQPSSETPTGLVLYYHGGGFRGGDEDKVLEKFDTELPMLLEQGYAVASAAYRLLDGTHDEGVLRCLNDSTYALQFIRYHSESLNIDPDNIILAGGSAGSSTSLWIGLQPDMANPDSEDPVKHQSTRVKALAIENTQSTLDIRRWQFDDEIFGEFNFTDDETVALGGGPERALEFYGIEETAENLADPMAAWETPEIVEYRQRVDMLDFFSSDDPELFANNEDVLTRPTSGGEFMHHSYHVRALKSAADSASVPGVYYYGPVNNREFESEPFETIGAFMLRKLAE